MNMNDSTQYMNWLEEQLAAISELPAKENEANAGK